MISSILFISMLSAICSAQLSTESVSEGPCMEDIDNYLAKDVNHTWLSISNDYYIPIASEISRRIYAQTFLGRPANSKTELAKMKLRIKPLPRSHKSVSRGFNPEIRVYQSCSATNSQGTQTNCTPIKKCSSPGTDLSRIKYDFRSIVYTDNKNVVMYVVCVNKKYRLYTVQSASPTLDSDTEEIIKQKIEDLGFDLKFINYQIY